MRMAGELSANGHLPLLVAADFPEIAIRIAEVAEVSTPLSLLGGLDDRCSSLFGEGHHLSDPRLGFDDVVERDAAEAAAIRRHARIGGKRVPRVEPQLRLPVAELEVDTPRMALV